VPVDPVGSGARKNIIISLVAAVVVLAVVLAGVLDL
jgi:hypothetical protein